jgi:uncharacterized RDD family membrane protein YckC
MQTSVAPEHCSSCGSPALPDGDFCLFCGDVLTESGRHIPVRLQGSTIIVPITESREYAGFWRRVWAGTIDVSLEVVAALLVTFLVYEVLNWVGRYARESVAYLAGFIFVPLLAVGGWLYAALSESSRYRATIGKRIMHLQVVCADGKQLNFGEASVRHVMKFLSLFTLGIGFLMAGFSKRRQALHDLPNDCLVIRVPEESFSLFGKHF